MSFYNTTNETAPQLNLFRQKAADQETLIAAFFERNWISGYTPSEIWARVFDGQVPLTSVRRAISDLTAAGVLVKTTAQRTGPYNRPEYVWRSMVITFFSLNRRKT